VLLARAQISLADQKYAGALRKFPQAREIPMQLVNRALELDPQSGEALVERGYLKLFDNVAAADTDLRRGIELAPNYARGYEVLAGRTIPECRPTS
jgi:hypothetical protein